MTEPELKGLLQAWGKGFRVSDRSEEFQLLVPQTHDALGPMESFFLPVEWGGILTPLYRLEDEVRRQFWLGLGPSFVAAAFVEGSNDRHGRRSVVLVGVTTPIDWQHVDLHKAISRTAALSRRYACAFAKTLDGAPSHLQQQLKDGAFLAERQFDLNAESDDTNFDWAPVAREIRKWRGITAIGTRHLFALGANVLYGSKEDGDAVAGIAGLLDPLSGELAPLSPTITLWEAANPQTSAPPPGVEHPSLDNLLLQEIRNEQRRLREQQERVEQFQREQQARNEHYQREQLEHQRRTLSITQAIFELAGAWYEAWRGWIHRR